MRKFHKQLRVDRLTIKAAMFVGKVHNLKEVLRGIKRREERSIQEKKFIKNLQSCRALYMPVLVFVCWWLSRQRADREADREAIWNSTRYVRT